MLLGLINDVVSDCPNKYTGRSGQMYQLREILFVVGDGGGQALASGLKSLFWSNKSQNTPGSVASAKHLYFSVIDSLETGFFL